MVGEERPVLALPVAGDLLDPAGDAGVRAGALAAREAFVGDIAREDVAEGELLLPDHRRADARRDELALLELAEVGIERLVVLDEGGDGAAPEDAADYGCLLQRVLLARLQQVDARGEDALHRVGKLDRGERVGGFPASVLVDDAALVDQLAEDLLEEERVALGAGEDRDRASRRRGRRHRAGARRARVAASWASGLRKTAEKLRRPPPQVGRVPVNAGRAGQTRRSGPLPRSATSSSRSRSAGSAQWMSSTTTTSGSRLSEHREQRAPGAVQLDAERDGWSRANSSSPVSMLDRERERGGRVRQIGEKLGNECLDPRRRRHRPCHRPETRDALQNLGERPVGDAVAVREAAPDEDPRALEPREQLAHEPALTDAGIAVDRDELRAVLSDHALLQREQEVELALATDERRVHARQPARHGVRRLTEEQGARAPDPPAAQLLARRGRRREAGSGAGGALGDDRLAGLGELLEPGGGVDGSAGDDRLAGRRVGVATASPVLIPVRISSAMPCVARASRSGRRAASRIASAARSARAGSSSCAVGTRTPPSRRRRCTSRPSRPRASISPRTAVEPLAHHVAQLLHVEAVGELRRAGHVREEDGHDLPLASRGRHLMIVRRSAAPRAKRGLDRRTVVTAAEILTSRFGYTEFRPGQQQVVESLLAGRSALST